MIRGRCSRWERWLPHRTAPEGGVCFWSLPIRANTKPNFLLCLFLWTSKRFEKQQWVNSEGGESDRDRVAFFVWPMLVTEIDQSERGCEVISMWFTAPQWDDWGGIKQQLREYREQRERVRNKTQRKREGDLGGGHSWCFVPSVFLNLIWST